MSGPRPRILAIDDTPANLLTLGAALSGEFDLQTATSGAMGLALATEAPPDLILLDVMMPEMDGFETCRRLKAEARLKDVPVVFVTALTELDSEMKGLALGAADYLSKPINVEIARQRIRNLLERERLRKVVEAQRDELTNQVAERQQAQMKLQESEARLHDIVDHSPIGMAIVSLAGRFIKVNRALCRIVGYAQEELVGLPLQELSHADDLLAGQENVDRLLRGELRWYEMEKRYVRKDGRIVWVQLTVSLYRDAQENPLHFIAQIQDINERKTVENELRATKQRLELALEASNLSLWDFDIGTGQVFLDENWAKIVGGAAGAQVTSVAALFQALHPDDRERTAGSAMATIKGATSNYREEIRVRSASGEWKWITCRGKVVERSADGRAMRAVGTNTDITPRKAAEAALASSEQRYRTLFENAPLGIALTTPDGRIVAANETMSRMFGYGAEELTHLNASSLYARPSERTAVLTRLELERALHGQEVELQRRDGTLFFGNLTVNQLDLEAGGMLLSMWEDISERKQAQMELRDSEARFRDIVDYSPIGIVVCSLDGQFVQANHALCAMLGYARDELEHLSFLDLTHPDDRAASAEQFHQLIAGKLTRYQIEKRYLRKDGKALWAKVTASMLRHVGHESSYVLGQIEDITESRLWHEQMVHQAHYDPLTDLPNRRLLLDRVDQALAEAQQRGRAAAVLFLDLDRFKEINDTLGHDVGDQLLKEVATRLKTCVRRGDTVSRLGGDEFVIVLTDLERGQDASIVSEKILAALGAPIHINELLLTVTTSIGISRYPNDATEDGRELIKKADQAMYAAKQDGRNRYRYYHETVDGPNA